MYKLPFHEVGGILHPRPMGNLWGSSFSSLDYGPMSGVLYRLMSGVEYR